MTQQKLDIPIVIADTSAIRDLCDIELASEKLPPEKKGQGFSVSKLINQMSINGGRTLIMPASILTELFPIKTGRLRLAMDDNEQATFPQRVGEDEFLYEDQKRLYSYLSELAQKGHVRCYNSCADMLKAGEIDRPKGGIVFADMGEERCWTGRTTSRRGFQSKVGDIVKNPDRIYATPPVPNNFKDQGDDDIFRMTKIIDEHVKSFGIQPQILLLNSDGGLCKRYEGVEQGNDVMFARPFPLIDALCKQGLLDNSTSEVANHALELLAENNRMWRDVAHTLKSKTGNDNRGKAANKIQGWLDKTKSAEPGNSR